eukprot:SAG11_NODE_2534_length_3245_cov_13.533058_1_plen_116_part_00
MIGADEEETGDLMPHEAVLGPDVQEAQTVECRPEGVRRALQAVEDLEKCISLGPDSRILSAGVESAEVERQLVQAWDKVFIELRLSQTGEDEGPGLADRIRGGPQRSVEAGSQSL